MELQPNSTISHFLQLTSSEIAQDTVSWALSLQCQADQATLAVEHLLGGWQQQRQRCQAAHSLQLSSKLQQPASSGQSPLSPLRVCGPNEETNSREGTQPRISTSAQRLAHTAGSPISPPFHPSSPYVLHHAGPKIKQLRLQLSFLV